MWSTLEPENITWKRNINIAEFLKEEAWFNAEKYSLHVK